MNIKNSLVIAAALCGLILTVQSGLSQGSLTPPGAPAPTMKSLDQIEPRTIVNAANTPGDSDDSFVISQPGSYYLTGNLTGVSGKNGIAIAASNVTLDLNGFVVQGLPGSQNGIAFPNAQTNIAVRNGLISGWGSYGVESAFSTSANLVFERLNVSACNGFGIYLDGAATVRECNCQENYGGITCSGGIVSGCTVNNNTENGIAAFSSTVSGCTANFNQQGISVNNGIVSGCIANNNADNGIAAYFSTVSGCTAYDNDTRGIYVESGTVSGCHVSDNTASGIYVDAPGSVVVGNICVGNNTGNSTFEAGIFIDDANNRIEDNHVSNSRYAGIQVENYVGYTNNIIIKNSVSGNGANNYVTPNTQIVGPIITTSGGISTASPWANFSF